MNAPKIQERTWWRAALRRVRRRTTARRGPQTTHPIGIGLIGAGNVARWQHLPALQRHADIFRLAAVGDADAHRACEVARQYGADACSNATAVVQHRGVDAVLVCTPTDFHAEGVLAAIEARKPVLSEKPLAASVEVARQLWSSARAAGVPTLINFSYRFRSDFSLVRDLVRDGVLGDVLQVWGSVSQGQWFDESGAPSRERSDAAPWKFAAGGGVVLDLGPHLIDLMRWWCGEIDRVQAWIKPAPRNPENDAACGIALGFANGTCAQLITSRLATGSKEQGFLELTGTKGALRFANGQISLWTRSAPRWRRLLLPEETPPDLLTCFRAAIDGRALGAPDFWDGYKNNEALAAVIESARTGAAIRLPLSSEGGNDRERSPAGAAAPGATIENVLVRG